MASISYNLTYRYSILGGEEGLYSENMPYRDTNGNTENMPYRDINGNTGIRLIKAIR